MDEDNSGEQVSLVSLYLTRKYFASLSFYVQLFISKILPFSLSGCSSDFLERSPVGGIQDQNDGPLLEIKYSLYL